MAAQQSTHFSDVTWDVIVVGAGMGGGTLGSQLAAKGWRVLFLEKGVNIARRHTYQVSDEPSQRISTGNWPLRMTVDVDGNVSRVHPPLGCGTGGTSLLYAAALERFSRVDFAPSDASARAQRGSAYDGWPIDYDSFLPYYEKAEALFRVRGTPDPLDPDDSHKLLDPPQLSEQEGHFMDSFEQAGMHPYRIHVGIEYVENCSECLGRICEQNCKSDSNRLCIQPVLQRQQAFILDECEVSRIEAGPDSVQHVVCHHQGTTYQLKARLYVLSASAYFTPVILLNSKNAHWPDGLLNRNGLIGRNLMFHISDFVALWPTRPCSKAGANKTISLRDFYRHDGMHMGSFQSTGLDPSYDHILYFLVTSMELSWFPWPRKPAFWVLQRIAKISTKMFATCSIFATILEDFPYADNRIELDPNEPGDMRVVYHMRRELKRRNRKFRKLLVRHFRRHKPRFLAGQPRLNFGHPSGTCRFGDDPAHSALNADCRAHDVDNLYVVDASFFPSSTGANPSLTIAANAIRVAEIMDAHLEKLVRAEQSAL